MIHLRKPTEQDLLRFKECLAVDPDHSRQNPDHWTADDGEFMVFFDEDNNRVWVRLERIIRVHFQHDPVTPKKENLSLIIKGLLWVIGSARKSKHLEVIFESRAPRLVQLLQRLFGIRPVEANYSVRT